MKNQIILLMFVSSLFLMLCTQGDRIAGAGSETVNSAVGMVLNSDKTPESQVIVQLVPVAYDVVKSGLLPSKFIDTTDEQGRYAFKRIDKGNYSIIARSAAQNTGSLVTGVDINGVNDSIPDAILRRNGSIRVSLPQGCTEANCYIYIPGTTLYAFAESGSNEIIIDSVPPGTIDEVIYTWIGNPTPQVMRYDVNIAAGDTAVVENVQWKYSSKLYLNTSETGAAVSGDIYNFPILVRLTQDNFDFSQARSGGEDIRFTKQDNTFLPFELEHWDQIGKQASVWVMVDTVLGNNRDQFITMYWGNSSLESESNSQTVFDTAYGYQGVWHLGQAGNEVAYDATANRYNGIPYGMSSLSSVPGIIGKAQDFDGTSSRIIMPYTANGKLDFPQDGYYSISLWAYADIVDTIWHGIAGKGHRQYYMQYKCFNADSVTWEFVEYRNQIGWQYSEFPAPSKPGNKQWVFLTGVREGNRQSLYINGEKVRDGALLNPLQLNRITAGDFTIGCFQQLDSLPTASGYSFFDGKIDEVRVMSFVPSADWVKLCYMNQKEYGMLVEFR